MAGATVMLPYGVPFESLNIYIFPYKYFFDLKFSKEIGFFSLSIFYPPWRELLKCSPMGSHLSLLIFISSPTNTFLISNSRVKSAFYSLAIFYIDGWDGWDGRVGPLFSFCSYPANYLKIIPDFFWTF